MCILVPNQKIKIRWAGNNREWYENKGYIFTKYGDHFDVDAEDLSYSSSAKIKYVCDNCGAVTTTSYHHYNSKYSSDGKYICRACSVQLRWDMSLKERQNDYYKRLLCKCSENGYVLNSAKSDIKNNNTYIEYICPKHGIKSMKIANFLSGKKCPECLAENNHHRFKHSIQEVVERVRQCGGTILNPEEYYNQDMTNLKFICPECGKEFVSSLKHFQQYGGQVCKDCSNYESLGEKKIRYFLEKHNIEYVPQKWFNDCRDKNPLPFDFYLPTLNTTIEFDGQQHFFQSNLFPETLELIQAHDDIKNSYCKKNNIKLIRIPYTDINKVDNILKNEIFSHKDIV